MSFINVLNEYESFDYKTFFSNIDNNYIKKILTKDKISRMDFLALLSEKASPFLEQMAKKAHKLTVQYFGHTISLYIPVYISNYCSNQCIYCGFNIKNKIKRKKLSLPEIETEARKVQETGMRHVLLLTGESRSAASFEYIKEAVKIMEKYFPSVSIEMFPMDLDEYSQLKKLGVDGLTVYQEVYDREIYKKVHLQGRKTDYEYRLNAPERGAEAGFRLVNIGALFGLGELEKEAFFSGLHAEYLQNKYLDTEFAVSLPRINPAEGGFKPYYTLSDKKFVQFMLAFRIFLPRLGINISTRESSEFRDHLIYLGATRFSAGSKTDVGGYSHDDHDSQQFSISDTRDTSEVVKMIRDKGFQPVFKDWELF